VALEYKHATKTGNFSDMPIEALVDRAGFGKKDRLLSENSALIDEITIR
jgi:hypothetical protein